ncbi:hypothetical protein ACWEPZ_13385 [Streptomyces sp. NPDC004288]
MTDDVPRIPGREIPIDTYGPTGSIGPGTRQIDGQTERRRWMIQGYGPTIRRQTRWRFEWMAQGEIPDGAWHEWENPTQPGRNPILHVAAWSWIEAVEEYKQRWEQRFGNQT